MGNINHKILLQGPGLADQKLVPFPSRAVALQMIPMYMRQMGQPVIILEAGKAVEYWWRDGIDDSQLILKIDLSEFENVYAAINSLTLSLTNTIETINNEILLLKNRIEAADISIDQINLSLLNIITSINQLTVSVNTTLTTLASVESRLLSSEGFIQNLINETNLIINEISLIKTSINNFTAHTSNTLIHVPSPSGQVNGRILETLNNTLIYADKPTGGGGVLYGIIDTITRNLENRIVRIRVDYGGSRFKETRCAYHTSGTAIGQVNFQEIKDDVVGVWLRIQFSYSADLLVAPTIRTNITNWSITI